MWDWNCNEKILLQKTIFDIIIQINNLNFMTKAKVCVQSFSIKQLESIFIPQKSNKKLTEKL